MNLAKSRAMFSKNIPRRRRDNFTSFSSIHFATSLRKYLGFPLIQGRVSKAYFTELMDKMKSHLAR